MVVSVQHLLQSAVAVVAVWVVGAVAVGDAVEGDAWSACSAVAAVSASVAVLLCGRGRW